MRLNPNRPQPADPSPIRLDRAYTLDELPTPALVVDVEAMQNNLHQMIQFLGHKGLQARPHTKTHKCPIIGHRQMEAGAVGLCCAKVSEAETMAAAGLSSLLITSPVVAEEKALRVVDLARTAGGGLMIVVDSSKGANVLSEIARRENVNVPVLIDLDPGIHRTGVSMGEPALELAKEIRDLKGLELWGLQAYAGQIMHVEGYDKRREQSLEFWEKVKDTRRLIEQTGISLSILTGGGTGTFDIDCDVEGLTDLQVGSFMFMDGEYRAIGWKDSDKFDAFETSLFVLVGTISQPVQHLITVDGGFKAFATDTVPPELLDIDGVKFHFAGDEHGILQLKDPSQPIELGDKLRVRVPHCDPTVNLYDHYYASSHGRVQEIWPIAARGNSQ